MSNLKNIIILPNLDFEFRNRADNLNVGANNYKEIFKYAKVVKERAH